MTCRIDYFHGAIDNFCSNSISIESQTVGNDFCTVRTTNTGIESINRRRVDVSIHFVSFFGA